MTQVIALVTTDQKAQKLDIFQVAWIHDTANQGSIEIAARNQAIGQRIVTITNAGGAEYEQRLSEFHDKLLSALGRFNMQITAYTGTAVIPPNNVPLDLKSRLIYLIVNP